MIRTFAFLFITCIVGGASLWAYPNSDPTILTIVAVLAELALIVLVFKPIRVNETAELQILVERHGIALQERQKSVDDQLARTQRQIDERLAALQKGMDALAQTVKAVSLPAAVPQLVEALNKVASVKPDTAAQLQAVINILPLLQEFSQIKLPDSAEITQVSQKVTGVLQAVETVLAEQEPVDLEAFRADMEKVKALQAAVNPRVHIQTVEERLNVFRKVFSLATGLLFDTYNQKEGFQKAINRAFAHVAPEYTWDAISLSEDEWYDFRQRVIRVFNSGSGWKDWAPDSSIGTATARLFTNANPHN